MRSKAVVLSGFRYGETSKIITLFTETSGKFAAVVKGVRNSKSKYGAVFENMNLIEVILNKKDNRDLQIISKAECINPFFHIKSDFDKLSAAYRMVELTSKTTYDYDPNYGVFCLLSESMKKLEEISAGMETLYLYFQIHLALHLGIDPLGINSTENSLQVNEEFRLPYKPAFRINENQRAMLLAVSGCELDMINIIKTDIDTIKCLQEVYNMHFMMNLQKFGYLKSHKIFEQLKK